MVDPPIIRRLRYIFEETRKLAESHGGSSGKMSWVLKSIMDEVLDALADETNPETLQSYLMLTSNVMKWAATGEMTDLPEHFRDSTVFAEYAERLELPAPAITVAHT